MLVQVFGETAPSSALVATQHVQDDVNVRQKSDFLSFHFFIFSF